MSPESPPRGAGRWPADWGLDASQDAQLDALLRLGGTLIDWRGGRDADEERAGDRAAETLGLRRADVLHVVPFAGALHRHLHVFEKVAETPARFPRRPGMALKRPLGR